MACSSRRRQAAASLRRLTPILHPILFAAFPLLSLFAQNQTEVELGVLWWPLAICAAVAVVLFGVFMLLFKREGKAGALASLVVVAFFYYGIFLEQVSV